MFEPIVDYLRTRYRGIVTLSTAEGTLIVLPQATDELADAGVMPDFAALSFAEKMRARAVYRPQSASGVDGEHTAESVEWLNGIIHRFHACSRRDRWFPAIPISRR
jgi:hypothetical protein